MVMGWVRTPLTRRWRLARIWSWPGSGLPVNSHQAWMCTACFCSIFKTSSCISHQSLQPATSPAFLFHFILASFSGKLLGRVLGKHSTIWSIFSRAKFSLFTSLTTFNLSNFFNVTLNANLVFSSTSLLNIFPSPKTSLGETRWPLGARTWAYFWLNSEGGYLVPSPPMFAMLTVTSGFPCFSVDWAEVTG